MRNKTHYLFIPAFIIIGLFAIQSIRPHSGPHNGRVQPAGNYYVEAGYNSRFIEAFVLDSLMHTEPNEGVTCIAIIDFPDGTQGNLDLLPYGRDRYRAPAPDKNYSSCLLSFTKDGQTITAQFMSEDMEMLIGTE